MRAINAIAALFVLSGVWQSMRAVGVLRIADKLRDAGPLAGLLGVTARYPEIYGVLRLAVAAATIAAGVALFQRRAWGRALAEGIAWLVIAFELATGLDMFLLMLTDDDAQLRTIGALVTAAVTAVVVVPAAIVIHYLRRPQTRAALLGR